MTNRMKNSYTIHAQGCEYVNYDEEDMLPSITNDIINSNENQFTIVPLILMNLNLGLISTQLASTHVTYTTH
ncbi:unnamed protein product [Rotaria sordida]|uniref:Uncharacterized protein n=1 Tax=Rotaria sordida TaxID=392033 RepID=A0A818RY79_9BILA|nr:unnamed protein product [Rotaria sordida]